MRKKAIATTTFFYIFMSFIFVAMVLFGLQRLFLLQDQLSEQERLEIRDTLESAHKYCSDPLNRGSERLLEFSHSKFNAYCIVNDANALEKEFGINLSVFEQTNENAVLLEVRRIEDGKAQEYSIVDSFQVDSSQNHCYFDQSGKERKVEIQLSC